MADCRQKPDHRSWCFLLATNTATSEHPLHRLTDDLYRPDRPDDSEAGEIVDPQAYRVKPCSTNGCLEGMADADVIKIVDDAAENISGVWGLIQSAGGGRGNRLGGISRGFPADRTW